MIDLLTGAVGAWLQLPGSASAELVGSVGFDFVCVDQQHGLVGDDALLPMLQALAAAAAPALVRVTHNEPAAIGRALDRGAVGVIVPLVDTAEQARAAVAACRYPPDGRRSYGPTRVGWREPGPDPLCVVMVETVAAVAALPGILDVPGLDGIFVGPSDLALSAGLPLSAQDGDPAFDDLLDTVFGACGAAGVPAGIYCASAGHARRFRARGATFTALLSEAAMLRAAAAAHLEAARG